MAQWIYTAKYDYLATRYDSRTGYSERVEVGNVSEIIIAETEAGARSLVSNLARRYEATGRPLRDERLLLSERPTAPADAAQPIAAPAEVAEVAVVERPTLRCGRCGAVGHRGYYPFSTLPGSGLCDDCA